MGNIRAKVKGSLAPLMPRAENSAVSDSTAAPDWAATASPNMASEFGQAPIIISLGISENTSGVNMKTPVCWGLELGRVERMRQTSRNMEAPAPPAIEEMMSMTGDCRLASARLPVIL